uniref:ATP-dependent DNA helicase n=1 Tax=Panagrolaimus davidi TaxID=227884 RepID=A0A914QGS6_9BILA
MAVPGPTSFKDIRTVDGVEYPTNREACVALGLVVNDKLYEDTLFEALNHTSPNQFRYLFARLLAHCDLGNPLELFDKFEDHLINDLLKKWSKEDAKKVAWRRIVKSMLNQDKHLSDYPELDEYMKEIGFENEDTIDLKALYAEGIENYNILNTKQKSVVNFVNERLENKEDKSCYIYVDGIGGSGKSFTFNTVRKLAMGKGYKVVIMACRTSITLQVLSIREGPTWKYLTCAIVADENEKIIRRVSLKSFSAETNKQMNETNVGDVIRVDKPWKYFEQTEAAQRRRSHYSDFEFCLKLHQKSSIHVVDAITKNVIDCYSKIQSSLTGITISGTVYVPPEKEKNYFLLSVEDTNGKIMEIRMKQKMDLASGDKITAKGKSSIVDGMITLDAEEVTVLADDPLNDGDSNKSDENDTTKK